MGFSRPIGQLRGSAAFDIVQREKTSELPIPRVRGDQLPAGLRAGAGEARQFCSKSSTLTKTHPSRTRTDAGKSTTFDLKPPNTKGGGQEEALLLLDRIKREKGVWWMPWQQEAMKDVILCDKLGGAENRP